MTEERADSVNQDEQEAMDWACLIMSDPKAIPDPKALDRFGDYQEAFSAWVAEKPERKMYYLSVVEGMIVASNAATRAGMRARKQQPVSKSRQSRVPMPLAASLAIGVIAGTGLLWRATSNPPALIAQSEARTPLETKVGEVRTEHLADGSSILLDTDTLLLVHLTADRRSVELKRGRARFLVVPDKKRPFDVRAAGITVSTNGGSFDIANRAGVRINPVEGETQVTVIHAAASDSDQSLRLRPGQLLSWSPGQSTEIAVIPAKRSDQQWVDGVKSFDNVPIREVIAEANTYSAIKIELASPALGNREIFADIDIRDIERVAEALSGFLDLMIDRSQKNRLLLTTKK